MEEQEKPRVQCDVIIKSQGIERRCRRLAEIGVRVRDPEDIDSNDRYVSCCSQHAEILEGKGEAFVTLVEGDGKQRVIGVPSPWRVALSERSNIVKKKEFWELQANNCASRIGHVVSQYPAMLQFLSESGTPGIRQVIQDLTSAMVVILQCHEDLAETDKDLQVKYKERFL